MIGCVPLQEPLETESVLPIESEPEIFGADVFTGGLVTTAVAADD